MHSNNKEPVTLMRDGLGVTLSITPSSFGVGFVQTSVVENLLEKSDLSSSYGGSVLCLFVDEDELRFVIIDQP